MLRCLCPSAQLKGTKSLQPSARSVGLIVYSMAAEKMTPDHWTRGRADDNETNLQWATPKQQAAKGSTPCRSVPDS